MFVQVPAPAGERWNWAEATPEPPSAELEETVTAVPRTFAEAAGAVSEPVGAGGAVPSGSAVGAGGAPAATVRGAGGGGKGVVSGGRGGIEEKKGEAAVGGGA